jgi:glycosyltransferase involved in cell wall biosynthesis
MPDLPDPSRTIPGIVVIGRNEGARLKRCLESVRTYSSLIAYVDSGSTDGSVETAERLGARTARLDMSQPFSAARARNQGFELLQSVSPEIEYVQFIDGDCELAAGWLDKALDFLTAHPEVAAICGRRRERFPEASVYNQLADVEWDTPVGEAAACGGDSLMRAEAFASVGGFRSQLIAGEEPELCSRMRGQGWKIWRIDADMTIHDAAMTKFGQWWRRGVRSGHGYAQVWSATDRRLYGRELKRAFAWGGMLPIAIAAAAFIHPLVAAAIASAYPLQIGRIALRTDIERPSPWAYACFTMLAKFPELQGAIGYLARAKRDRA